MLQRMAGVLHINTRLNVLSSKQCISLNQSIVSFSTVYVFPSLKS